MNYKNMYVAVHYKIPIVFQYCNFQQEICSSKVQVLHLTLKLFGLQH